jgi:protein kinase C substrate 80K-H
VSLYLTTDSWHSHLFLALYESLQSHKKALESYRRLYDDLKARDQALSEILATLREGYNPNYQDMAVLEAVRGWEAVEGITSTESKEQGQGQETQEPEEELERGTWTEEQLERQLDGLIEQDHLSLILSHESYLETANGGASPCE